MSIKISKCSSPLSDICRIRTTVRMHKWYPELSTTKVFITIHQCLSLFMTIFGNEHLTALLQQKSMKECFKILIVFYFSFRKTFPLLLRLNAVNLLKLAYMLACRKEIAKFAKIVPHKKLRPQKVVALTELSLKQYYEVTIRW